MKFTDEMPTHDKHARIALGVIAFLILFFVISRVGLEYVFASCSTTDECVEVTHGDYSYDINTDMFDDDGDGVMDKVYVDALSEETPQFELMQNELDDFEESLDYAEEILDEAEDNGGT